MADAAVSTCPYCAESIKPAAAVCPHCTREQPWSINARKTARARFIWGGIVAIGIVFVFFIGLGYLGVLLTGDDDAAKDICHQMIDRGYYEGTWNGCLDQMKNPNQREAAKAIYHLR